MTTMSSTSAAAVISASITREEKNARRMAYKQLLSDGVSPADARWMIKFFGKRYNFAFCRGIYEIVEMYALKEQEWYEQWGFYKKEDERREENEWRQATRTVSPIPASGKTQACLAELSAY